jgi:hypothetical protein
MLRGVGSAFALTLAGVGLLPAAVVGSAGAAPLRDRHGAARAAAAIPPQLQALEQKGLALQVTSARFSFNESISTAGALGGLFGNLEKGSSHGKKEAQEAAPTPLIEGTGEESFAPLEGSFQTSFLGLKSAGRLIGTTLYEEEPEITRIDGGRPWVELPNQDLGNATGVTLTTLGGAGGGGAQLYGAMFEAVNRARSITEVGPQTVEGQPATVYDVLLELRTLDKGTAAERHSIEALVKPLVEVELAMAEDGLPLRTVVKLRFRGHKAGEMTVESSILAINVPIAPVQVPPADQTITEAQLKRLLAPKHRTKKLHSIPKK